MDGNRFRLDRLCGRILYWAALFFLPVLVPASGPPQLEDSLRRAILLTDDAVGQAGIYLALAESVMSRSPDSALFFVERARRLNPRSSSLDYLGRLNLVIGDIYYSMGNAARSYLSYRVALVCFRHTGNKIRQMEVLNKIGNNYSASGNSAEALQYYLECKEIADTEHDADMQARLQNNIGRIYTETGDLNSAIEYFQRAISIFEKTGDSVKKATVELNLAGTYSETGDLEKATRYLEKAASVLRGRDNKVLLGLSSNIKAHSFFVNGHYEEALRHLWNSYATVKQGGTGESETRQQILLTRILDNIGNAYYLLQQYQKAKRFLLEGYRISISLSLLSETVKSSDHLSKTYEKLGQGDSALFYFKVFKQFSDSLVKIQSINIVKLAEVRMAYEKDVNEKKALIEMNRIIQKRNLVIFFVIGLILVTLVIILFMKLKIEKQKKIRMMMEIRHSEFEKRAADEKLEAQNKELFTKVMHFTTANELIIRIAEKLKKMEVRDAPENLRIKNELINELSAAVYKEDSWKEFEIRFQNVQSEFYSRLHEKFPSLSSSEVRLCAFLKLKMSTKEISAVTHQSDRAIVVSRYRLRQKLGLTTNENLTQFLAQF